MRDHEQEIQFRQVLSVCGLALIAVAAFFGSATGVFSDPDLLYLPLLMAVGAFVLMMDLFFPTNIPTRFVKGGVLLFGLGPILLVALHAA